nr:hypothetical protein [Tanacetum cinerariifolium]
MEEYIRLEEEKARRHGNVYNWETVKYGKIWYDEDVHDLRSVVTKFLTIVFNDKLTSEEALPCEPTVNSENDNEKVNIPSFPSPEPMVSYLNDLDFFKDFENEFLAIVYNDALTSKLDFLIEPILSPQHIDEFDFKDETSLFEYNEEEQNILYFNDLFPFNIVYLDDLKLDKDNDNNEIDIIQSSRVAWNYLNNGMLLNLIKKLYVPFGIPFEPKRYYKDGVYIRNVVEAKVEGYTEEIVHDFEDRFETIFGRQVNRVQVLDFKGLTLEMRQDLAKRLRMFILALGFHTAKEMAKDGFEAYGLGSERVILDKGDLSDYRIEISFDMDFLRATPSYTYIKDSLQRLYH